MRPLMSSRGKSLSGAGRVAQDKRSRQLLSFSGAKCGIQDKIHGRLLRLEHILALTGMLNESSSIVEVYACVCVCVCLCHGEEEEEEEEEGSKVKFSCFIECSALVLL